LLLWLRSSLSPQDIRDRVLGDEQFRDDLLLWLDSCHQGQFSLSNEAEIRERIKQRKRNDKTAVPNVASDNINEDDMGGVEDDEARKGAFRDPCTCLVAKPPTARDEATVQDWIFNVMYDTDEIVYMSNRHDRHHRHGCMRGFPQYCKARFPREIRKETGVDPETGALRFKKMEAWINTYNVVLSYVLRFNTDVTCLLSGTQVRAIIAYVTDYVTKSPLNMYSILEAIKTV
ncbi:uncharacterized protein TRAVEDRAFT_83978, partial [Trametes versicolor FP-101664 SS1]|uniref:uncharacterized protein n=1 Tax=Trametes versicolor (strain FP-101664) TaxID=717944 RepID=UPI00046240AE